MRMSYSTAAERTTTSLVEKRARGRQTELLALVAASVVSLIALRAAYSSRTADAPTVEQGLTTGRIVDLTRVDRPEQLLAPFAAALADPGERRFAADRVAAWLSTPDGSGAGRRRVERVADLGTITVSEADLGPTRHLPAIRERLAGRRTAADSAGGVADARIPLLTAAQMSALRPALVVRPHGSVRAMVALAAGWLLVGFYAAHVWARVRRSTADPWVLPILHVLCGIGLAMMVSLRDPWRDAVLFSRFAQGTAVGCLLLAVVSSFDIQRTVWRRLSYVPLLGAVALSILLIVFGSGPGTSDAKVNLFGAQPVEAIRLLVVFFLAGYFANRWEFLRELREPRIGPGRLGFDIPRLDYVWPVLAGMAVLLVFFFLQKDLGPALVLACVFLALYGVARGRITMAVAGLALLAAGFLGGYALGYPRTVVHRVQMWLSPWDNAARGGDQVAHALWALSTGAVGGTGLGRGDPSLVPTAHTDLVLAGIGEEAGLIGLLVVYALYGVLVYRAFRIALRASGDYTCLLAVGLTLAVFLQLALIAAGLLGLAPLAGVATPFLSYGRSAMLANFVAMGLLLGISRQTVGREPRREFVRPVLCLGGVLAAMLLAVVVRTAYVQTLASDRIVAAAALVRQADGARRFEYNPRLLAAAQRIVRGTITDRHGVPLATSRPEDLRNHAADFTRLGISAAAACPTPGARCYPFGGITFHLLGDWRSQVNWAAGNTSYVERDNDRRLRGYDDHARVVDVRDPVTGRTAKVLRRDLSALVPLLRHRHDPDHEEVKRLLAGPRDVRLSLDVRLQIKVAALVASGVQRARQREGAAVVMTPEGDVLALVNYPWPALAPDVPARAETEAASDDPDPRLLDRARYGMYPPGSSFKLVTATAALRKDPALAERTFLCQRLPDGRVGARIPGWTRPVRDDPQDTVPHGTLAMTRGLIVSCNAYFAQLGLHMGGSALQETAALFEIPLGQPESAAQIRDTLPFASYGQGQVLASPFKMARVAATIAAGGTMPQGRWVGDETNARAEAPRPVLAPPLARVIGQAMRRVVTEGTGRALADVTPAVAGKTGTAEVQHAAAHAWFIGFAPYDTPRSSAPAGGKPRDPSRIAFAVLVEHGGYGGAAAAPVAGGIVTAAREIGVIR